jgi:hypothetical protein
MCRVQERALKQQFDRLVYSQSAPQSLKDDLANLGRGAAVLRALFAKWKSGEYSVSMRRSHAEVSQASDGYVRSMLVELQMRYESGGRGQWFADVYLPYLHSQGLVQKHPARPSENAQVESAASC